MFLPVLAGLAGAGAAATSGLGLAATIGSSVLGAVGSVMGGFAAKASGDYQAQVARNNAILARQAAEVEDQRGGLEAQAQDQKTKALLAAQQVGFASSGIDITSGSALDAQEGSAKLGRLDTLNTKYNSDKKVNNLQNQALTFDSEAEVAESKGAYGLLSGFLGAGTSILGGVSSFSDKWAAYKKAGV
mgnify:CR=1 FL=1